MSAQVVTTRFGDLIAFTLLTYDYLLTFPAEVRHFWRRPRRNLVLVLFFVTRYFALCLHIFNVTRVFYLVEKMPKETVERACIVFIQLLCAAIMAMRVYAFYEKSRIVLATLAIVAVGVVCFGLWALFLDPSGSGGSTSCYVDAALAVHMALVWAGQLVFDAVLFILTVWRSFCIGKVGDRMLVDILLRDGSMYFAVISVVNAANIIVLLLASDAYKPLTGTFTSAMSVILVSRLVINLQEPISRRLVESTEDDHPTMTTFIPLDDVPWSMRVDESVFWPTR